MMMPQQLENAEALTRNREPRPTPTGRLSSIPLDRWQYRVTSTYHPGAENLNGLWLSVGEGLPQIDVTQHRGRPAGVLLGFPIDLNNKRIVRGRWQVPSDADLDTEEGIHCTLRSLGGRYIWIVPFKGGMRLYPDAATQVCCVWDAHLQSAGSTTGAILAKEAYAQRFNAASFKHQKIIGEGWFPAGLTAHDGVKRLLPNHYLDLSSWTAHRFVAVAPSKPDPETVMTALETTIRAQVEALTKGPDRVVLALTAGRESRAILACLRHLAADLQFVTATGTDRHQTDANVAKRIAATLGLNHICLKRRIAKQQAQDLFLKRGGHCFGDGNMADHPSVHPLALHHVFCGGLGGEIARAFYWSKSDQPDRTVTADLLMQRFGMRPSTAVAAALENWLLELPKGLKVRDILDLAYLELRLGPWAMAQFCADPTVVRYAPMITYDTVRLMLDLPDNWKADQKLNEALVARNWPALNNFPYNSLGFIQDNLIRMRRVIHHPSLLIKKFHQAGGRWVT